MSKQTKIALLIRRYASILQKDIDMTDALLIAHYLIMHGVTIKSDQNNDW